MMDTVHEFLLKQATIKYGSSSAGAPVYFLMSQLTAHLEMGKLGPNSSQMRELADCLIRLKCIRPGRSGCRHPDTKEMQKWWIWNLPAE
jgi:hypothetical protein